MPPSGPLGELTAASRARASGAAASAGRLRESALALPQRARLGAALRAANTVGVIAEIKRRSPSKGSINEGIDASARAREYAAGGALALSVLTEPDRFGGALADLDAVAAAVSIPLLRKDFITAEVQLLEALAHGASAALLIARALPPGELTQLALAASALGLEPLVEVRNEAELATAIALPGALIGVNNRDLETLVIEEEVTARLIPLIPADRIAIYESGVRSREEVLRAAALGADAVLVGSGLSLAVDGRGAVKGLTGVPRASRG